MMLLCAGGVGFVFIHLFVSRTGLRSWLVARIGEGPYMGLFSLASLGTVGLMVAGYQQASLQSTYLWFPPWWLIASGLPLMLVAYTLVLIGLTTPSPTTAGMEHVLQHEEPATGILRISRHPFLAGMALWSGYHLTVNGDTASMAVFLPFFITSLAGPSSIDRKRREKHGERWAVFEAKTSILPFAAIVQGKNRWVWAEIGWLRLLGAFILFLVLLVSHQWLFGVSPYPP
ncbi:MAG: NnrU family protein [Myxococcota bacterium]